MDDPSEDQARIYDSQAEEYDALISAEDVDCNLIAALERIASIDGADIADIGAGTGRISRLIGARTRSLVLVERAAPMLEVARRRLDAMGVAFRAHLGDARALPLPDASVDVAIAGWVFGHFRAWMPSGWRAEVGQAIAEMRRIVRPGGRVVVIETLGTGHTEPREHEGLDEYFAELETKWGLERTWIRTDYVFPSVEEAARICGTFFGPAMADRIEAQQWRRVPECTALFSQAL
jgi:ubiquinone/menaquinone biosynthesis C-methylase UbiE